MPCRLIGMSARHMRELEIVPCFAARALTNGTCQKPAVLGSDVLSATEDTTDSSAVRQALAGSLPGQAAAPAS